MWNQELIPFIEPNATYSRQDVMNLIKAHGINQPRLPEAFQKMLDWDLADFEVSGQLLINSLQSYKPVRGRRPVPANEKRDISRQIRVTEKEHRFLERAAGIFSQSISQFILTCLFDEPLPSPDHGMNIEISYFLDRVIEDKDFIENQIRDGKIEFIDLNLFTKIQSQAMKVKQGVRKVHEVKLDLPPQKDRRTKRIHLVLSAEDDANLTEMRKSLKMADLVREKAFSRTTWQYCRSIKEYQYDRFKAVQWELAESVAGIQAGEEPEVLKVLKTVSALLDQTLLEISCI
jgi:hypothetical protein